MTRAKVARLGLAAVAIALTATPAARAQNDKGHYTCTSVAGITFFNDCAGEEILITDGQLCISSGLSTDGSGGLHVDAQIRQDFTGVGLTTGQTYTGHLSANVSQQVNGNGPQFTVEIVQNYHLNTSGPQNNLHLKEVFHITVNANGDPTAMTFTLESGCR
jgi:hypothetical protein